MCLFDLSVRLGLSETTAATIAVLPLRWQHFSYYWQGGRSADGMKLPVPDPIVERSVEAADGCTITLLREVSARGSYFVIEVDSHREGERSWFTPRINGTATALVLFEILSMSCKVTRVVEQDCVYLRPVLANGEPFTPALIAV